ncbi:unnamed protein product [Prunus armeniaca]|uniref:WAT1-related protein n=1 Tax=Prunus armeniaca TaxID=36596 RepID=A0A6J5UXI7_PRUAR|nr:unnamed protein product [Prunus armeniaca]
MEGNFGRLLSDYLANMLYLHLVSQTSSPLLCFAGFHIVSRVALNIGDHCKPMIFPFGAVLCVSNFASAMQNSVPAITFLMALALRLERINITRKDGLAKVMGTIASLGGATVITLHQGLPLLNQTQPIQGRTPLTEEMSSSTDMQNWKWGCIYLLGHCVAWASWMVFQYPAKLTLTSFTCFFGLIQFLAIAVFVETEFENWKIQSGEELFTILYAYSGPVFVAVFQPLQTTLGAVMATLVLGDQLYSGGIIGALLIMLGLYSVLWG